jgi:type I restriction enzyme S subunit
VKDDFWPHDTTLWVKDFHGNDPRFVYYFFKSIAARLAALDVGSANPTLNRNHVHPIPTIWPALSVQKRVATTLAMLDDRIELLRQTNTTLESIAQSLFKSWFIDFDPVRAKAEGREPEGIDATTVALFPDSFEESALGDIPKGWRVGTFGDLAGLAKGSVNPMTAPADTFEHYSLPAFDASQLPVFELGEAIKSNKTRMPVGAVLQSKLNPHIPRVWFPSRVGDRAVCSTEFLPWITKGTASTEVIYCTLTSPAFAASVRTLVTGTSNSHQRVKPDQVAALAVALAPSDVYDAFTRTVRALLAKVGENRWTAKSLVGLRDTLLPCLVSGKLQLPEVEAQLDEALA